MKNYKIKPVSEGYKVLVRTLLFWWMPIKGPFKFGDFSRDDRIFKTKKEAKKYIKNKTKK